MSGAALLPCVQDRDDPLRDVHPTMAEFARPFMHLGSIPTFLDAAHDKAQPRRFAAEPAAPSAFAEFRDEDEPDAEADLQRDQLRDHMERCR